MRVPAHGQGWGARKGSGRAGRRRARNPLSFPMRLASGPAHVVAPDPPDPLSGLTIALPSPTPCLALNGWKEI